MADSTPGDGLRDIDYGLFRENVARYEELLSGEDPTRVPIYVHMNYRDGIAIPRWGCGSKPSNLDKADLFKDPELYLDWQTRCLMHRMELALCDDWIPSLFAWYGVCVLASAFGCPVEFHPGQDPWARPALFDVKEVYSLRRPDLRKSGLCKKVLETIKLWQDRTEARIPIRVNNDQSALDVATQVLAFTEFLAGIYEHPQEIHHLLSMVTDAIIEWQDIQEEVIENRWEGGWEHRTPPGGGALLADDVLINLSPSTYEEFGVPYNSRVSGRLGGLFIHYCAHPDSNPLHNLETLLKMDGFKGVETQMRSVEELVRVRDTVGDTAVVLCAPPPGLGVREHLALMKGSRHILYLDPEVSAPGESDELRQTIAVARECSDNA